MAKKYTIDLEVNQNAQQASKDFDKLNKSIKGTNDEFEKTEKTMGNAQGVDKLTQRLAELDAQLESGDVSLRDMNKLIMEYQTVAAQAGSESPVGDQAIQKAAALQDQVTDLRNRTKLLSSDYVALDTTLAGIGVGAQAFSGITSAMALTGVESEKLREAMLKVQAVQGVANSISAITNALNKDAILGIKARIVLEKAKNVVIGKSTGLMKGLRVAMAATGIGLLVTGIAALITNFKSLFGFMEPVIQAFKDFGDLIGLTNFAEEEQAEERELRHQNEMARIEAEREARQTAFNERQDQFDREIALAKALGKSTFELEKKKIQDKIDTNKKEAKLNKQAFEDAVAQNKTLEKIYKNASETEKGFLRAGLEANRERIKEYKKYTKAVKDGTNELKVFLIEADNEIKEKEKSNQKERASNYKKYAQNRINAARKIEDEQNQLLEDGIEKELEINRDKFRRLREDIERNQNLIKTERLKRLELNTKLEAQEEKKIRDKFKKQKEAQDEKDRQEEDKKKDEADKKRIKKQEELFKLELSLMKDRQMAEIIQLTQQFEEKFALAEGNAELEKQLEEELNKQKFEITEKYRKKEKDAQDKQDKEERENKIAMSNFAINSTKQGLDIIAGLTDIYGKQSEKAAKRAFQIQKGVSIAQATIDTYKSANAIFAAASANPSTVLFPAQPFIAAGLAITAGLANVATIASQKFEGGGDTGGGATPTGGGLEAGGGGAITPEFNVVGDSGINQLAQLQQQPVQAYVVSGEVTTAQALDRNRVQNATL